MVFIQAEDFKSDYQSMIIQLPVPTNSTLEIVHYALDTLREIFKDGNTYRKVGVIVSDITNKEALQLNIFDKVDRQKHTSLMQVIDKYNRGFDKNQIQLAIQGVDKSWRLRRNFLSPCFTTRLSDIIKIN